MTRRKRLFQLAIFVLFLGVATTGSSKVHAVGETYALTATPDTVQESSVTGVALVLNVSNARPLQPYSFEWTVDDPSSTFHRASNATTPGPGQTSFILSVVYPRDFSGAGLNLVGTYSVSVRQTSPPNAPNVASGRFVVSITDIASYQRTFPVLIEAIRYAPNENVTINIESGDVSAAGFPSWRRADSTGLFSYWWQIPAQAPVGVYTATLTGVSTVKSPRDSQPFTINETSVGVAQLEMDKTIFQRSETAEFRFRAVYPSGLQATSGSGTIRLTLPDSSTLQIVGSYDSTIGIFRASYKTSLSIQTGAWAATLESHGFDDGYGNSGPDYSPSRGFTVQPALLEASLTVANQNQNYATGDTIVLWADVVKPDGTAFDSGTVSASLSLPGMQPGRSIDLSYDQTAERWFGSFTTSSSDPAGLWLLGVSASDDYGNHGTASTSLSISPSYSTQTTSLFYVALAVIGAAAFAIVFFLMRRRMTKEELKLDLKVLDGEAQKVQEKDFFKRIKEQVDDKEGAKKDEK